MKKPPNYVGESLVEIRTISRRMFSAWYTMYGEEYRKAVGEVRIRVPGGAPPFYDSTRDMSIVKETSPTLPEGGYTYPLRVREQSVTRRGVILRATVDYSESNRRGKDVNHHVGTFEGQELEIVLFSEQFKN